MRGSAVAVWIRVYYHFRSFAFVDGNLMSVYKVRRGGDSSCALLNSDYLKTIERKINGIRE